MDEIIQGSNGSFIFNLTDNLRLEEMTNARLGQNIWYYTRAFPDEDDNDTTNNYNSNGDTRSLKSKRGAQLKFGQNALIIKDDFKTVSSDLTDELCFTLNGDPMLRGKVRSLIEPIKTYKPRKMEIWNFREYHTVMRKASFSSNEGRED